ncbi:MAG: leucine--tRNA ligase [Deltaproteobacteria bacterium]|jgi:leucyl-tRNA synthetase|nr:leucine--tRNA ligase [Deltaproteobacteria bacterium]MBW2532664.1 leucine--tRNA ligase [Deltaproteobacteria bacterium]
MASHTDHEGAAAGDEHGQPRYDHLAIEARWQRFWEREQTFRAERRAGRDKRYVLDMFPYPSGAGLHVGHPEGYTASDIMARYWRMRGFDVLHPIGWDSFGLPAEQHAVETGTHPAVTTHKNIETFKRQLKMLGFSYDWSRELATTDNGYVRWTQWIFLQLFHQGLAYQAEMSVNWCPALGTVLANEEVIDGKSERGAHPVVRMPLRQWMLKITAYADRLASGLADLDWPVGTLEAQKRWIGRSEGADVRFGVADHPGAEIAVFTTRPDTLMGVTYMVLAPEHPLVDEITAPEQRGAVDRYVEQAAKKSDRDRIADAKTKTGEPTGAFALHPITGRPLPIWVSDYVVWGYGTGAVMAVPGHDERDFAFAKTFGLPIVEVVSPDGTIHDDLLEAYTGDGTNVQSGPFDGLSTLACKEAVIAELERLGQGGAAVNYRLRDWVFSRQRYWGEPIPIYFPVELEAAEGDPRQGAPHRILYDQPIAVEESELPVELPALENYEPGDEPAGALARAVDWRYFQQDGKWFARETNTMPQWAGSCWYYLRFVDPHNAERGWSEQAERDWMPVDLYVGGAEHAVLHLLYARFWHQVLFDAGAAKDPEPFLKLVHQGMILGEDNEKMSKSRGNVVNPDDIVRDFGADAMRMYEMFMGPLEAVKPWQTAQIQGVVRFRDRVFTVCTRELTDELDEPTLRLLHKTIKKVTGDVERMAFNTALTALMVLCNHLMGLEPVPRQAAEALALLVSPFAPHLGEELWHRLGHGDSLAYQPWPTFDEALCVDDTIEIGVQVNGKTRGTVQIAKDASEEDARAAALAVETVGRHVEGKTVRKFIYVPGKIINFVAK